MNRIYWDTMLFAYLLENNPEFGEQARRAFESILERGDRVCTSVFTLGEVLVKPKMLRNDEVCKAIRNLMHSTEVDLLHFTSETAEEYGSIRATTRLKAADAIHVATAIAAGVDFFVTNDFQIQKMRIPGLRMVVGLDGRIW